MKICAFIVILTLTLSACQASSPLPTPTVTFTITPTPFPTPTPEPTAIPETPEQGMVRLAEAAVQNNWNPNDETTWGQLQGLSAEDAAFLAQMQAINADPNTKTKEQLVSYDAFLTLMRKEQLARDLYSPDAAIAANTNSALDKFLASGFVTSVPTQEQVALMKVNQTDFAAWLETLSPEQIFHLERMYCNENGIELMPSHIELWRMVDQFAQATRDGKILYASNVAIDGTMIGSSGEYSGMWLDRSRQDDFRLHTIEYPITMFGEVHNWIGNWFADEHRIFAGAALRLPYDNHGIAGEIVGSDGVAYFMPVILAYDGALEYGYTDHRLANAPNVDLDVAGASFSTRLQPDYRFDSFQNLTLNDILFAAQRRATLIMRTSGVTFPNGNVSFMFFEKETGLPIFGSSNMQPSGERSAIYIIP